MKNRDMLKLYKVLVGIPDQSTVFNTEYNLTGVNIVDILDKIQKNGYLSHTDGDYIILRIEFITNIDEN